MEGRARVAAALTAVFLRGDAQRARDVLKLCVSVRAESEPSK